MEEEDSSFYLFIYFSFIPLSSNTQPHPPPFVLLLSFFFLLLFVSQGCSLPFLLGSVEREQAC